MKGLSAGAGMQQQESEKPRIYLVDDDRHFLAALQRFLTVQGFEAVGFDSPADFLAAHDPERRGCLLLDLNMLEMSGLDIQARLRAAGQERPVIFLTGDASVSAGIAAMKQGARDYLTKPVQADILLAAVEDAVREDAALRSSRAGKAELLGRWNALSPRERQVLDLVVQGRLNKQIAFELNLSEQTVKAHRGRVMRKMKARSTTDLVHMAEVIAPHVLQRPSRALDAMA
jgi:FixJ family two-component response regulator